MAVRTAASTKHGSGQAASAAPAPPQNAPAAAAASSTAAASSKRSGFSFNKQWPKPADCAASASTPLTAVVEAPPAYEIVHRGMLDWGSSWGDAVKGLADVPRCPKELIVRVQLPGCRSSGEAELDVGGAALALRVPGRYCLEVALPCQVDAERGTARFDAAKQLLAITLPVLPPSLPPGGAGLAASVAAGKQVGDAAGSQAAITQPPSTGNMACASMPLVQVVAPAALAEVELPTCPVSGEGVRKQEQGQGQGAAQEPLPVVEPFAKSANMLAWEQLHAAHTPAGEPGPCYRSTLGRLLVGGRILSRDMTWREFAAA